MKKIAFLLIFAHSVFGQANLSLPSAPQKVEFTNIMVNLDRDALDNVNKEITNLLTPQNRFLEQKLERMQWYLPIIENILEQENVPDDIKYLCVMESSLLPEAVSSSNAVGFWQFKEGTAKDINMLINDEIDDRKNIYFSTKGAATYLKKNNLSLKNWISTIYSFYQGLEGAKKAIPVSWTNANELNFDAKTPNYLIKAIAHRIAFEHRLNRLKESPRKFFEYAGGNRSLAEISSELNADLNEVKKYNAWLSTPLIPIDRTYKILVPILKDQSETIEAKVIKNNTALALATFPELRRITELTTSLNAPIFYEINGKKGILSQAGQEAVQMAKLSNVKVKRFLRYNDMKERDLAKIGKIYYLERKAKKAKVPYHTIAKEQTLWDISQMYGIKLKNLISYNSISKNEILQQGRIIWMQSKRPKNTPIEYQNNLDPVETKPEVVAKTETKKEVEQKRSEPLFEPKNKRSQAVEKEIIPSTPVENKAKEPVFTKMDAPVNTTHKVASGETLYAIAQKYGLSLSEIRALNNMNQTDPISAGQVLLVKKSATKTTELKPSKTEIAEVKPSKTEVLDPKPNVLPKEQTVANVHIVRKGETAYSISKRYGLSVNELLTLNNMSGPTIEIDQELKVGGIKNTVAKPTVSQAVVNKPAANNTVLPIENNTHKVQAGETMYSISKKYGLTVDELKRINGFTSNTVSLGSYIKVKR